MFMYSPSADGQRFLVNVQSGVRAHAERDQQLGEGRAQEQLRLEAVIGSSCGYRKVTFFFRRIVAARFIEDGLSGFFPDCRYTSTTFLRGSHVCAKREF